MSIDLLEGFDPVEVWRPASPGMVEVTSDGGLSWSDPVSTEDACVAAGAGAHVLLSEGTFYEFRTVVRDNQWFRGSGAATILDGTIGLPEPVEDGDVWYFEQPVPGFEGYDRGVGEAQDGEERVLDRYDLWRDGVRLRHASSLEEMGADEWFIDYDADRIYVGFHPGLAMSVRLAFTDFAFSDDPFEGGVGDPVEFVTLENMTMRRYAGRAQRGAVNLLRSPAYVGHCTVVECHASNVSVYANSTVTNCEIGLAVQIGVRQEGDFHAEPFKLLNSHIYANGQLPYDYGWEGGAMKIVTSIDPVVENCVVERSEFGIWFDVSNIGMKTRSNVVKHIVRHGIFYEISFSGEVVDNEVFDCGQRDDGDFAGITMLGTQGTSIANNAVYDCRIPLLLQHPERGDSGPDVPAPWTSVDRDTIDVSVEGNAFTLTPGMPTPGLRLLDGSTDTDPLTSNTFDENRWIVDDVDAINFYWHPDPQTFDEWQADGRDLFGEIVQGDGKDLSVIDVRLTGQTYGPVEFSVELDEEDDGGPTAGPVDVLEVEWRVPGPQVNQDFRGPTARFWRRVEGAPRQAVLRGFSIGEDGIPFYDPNDPTKSRMMVLPDGTVVLEVLS